MAGIESISVQESYSETLPGNGTVTKTVVNLNIPSDEIWYLVESAHTLTGDGSNNIELDLDLVYESATTNEELIISGQNGSDTSGTKTHGKHLDGVYYDEVKVELTATNTVGFNEHPFGTTADSRLMIRRVLP